VKSFLKLLSATRAMFFENTAMEKGKIFMV
jgi:hypothetical protein